MKQKDYWNFRNGHTHVIKNLKPKRRPEKTDAIIPYFFRLGRTSADCIYYTTLEKTGFVSRSISINRVVQELQSDLQIFFDAAVTAMRSYPER